MTWTRWAWKTLAPYFDRHLPCGIGIVCGNLSDNLEVLDFDDLEAWLQWSSRVDAELLSTLPVIATPSNGRHLYYRCLRIGRKADLARDEVGHPLIELKGQGSMITAAGSPLPTHASGKPYILLQGDPRRPPVITPAQREALIDAARTLNRYESPQDSHGRRPAPKKRPQSGRRSGRPGDKFNAETEWADIMEGAGWHIQCTRGDTTYWTKPFSRRGEVHATTNYKGLDLLKVFSSDAPPFDTDTTYTKFAAYAMLNHKGDFSAAARALSARHNP